MKSKKRLEIRDLSVIFRQSKSQSLLKRKSTGIYALKHINLTMYDGDIVGVIGGNGSGKSTLLRVIAGIIQCSEKNVWYADKSKISSIMSLGMGYNSDLSGTDNSFLHAMLHGCDRKRAKELIQPIREFSGLDKYMEYPIRTYSLGMYQRLTFANIIHLEPNIVLIDEAISAGDSKFRKRIFDYINSLRSNNRLFVIVSHELSQLAEICNRCIWLKEGSLTYSSSDVHDVMKRYADQF